MKLIIFIIITTQTLVIGIAGWGLRGVEMDSKETLGQWYYVASLRLVRCLD
jgi:hypothetical protein